MNSKINIKINVGRRTIDNLNSRNTLMYKKPWGFIYLFNTYLPVNIEAWTNIFWIYLDKLIKIEQLILYM